MMRCSVMDVLANLGTGYVMLARSPEHGSAVTDA